MLEVSVDRYLELLAGKIPRPYCFSVAHVSRESWMHAKFLSELSGSYGKFEVNVDECRKCMGEVFMKTYSRLNKLANEIETKWSLTPKESAEYLQKNLDIENLAGEEYTSALAMSALKLIGLEELDESTHFLNDVFEEIGKEEEYHIKILRDVIESLEKNY